MTFFQLLFSRSLLKQINKLRDSVLIANHAKAKKFSFLLSIVTSLPYYCDGTAILGYTLGQWFSTTGPRIPAGPQKSYS